MKIIIDCSDTECLTNNDPANLIKRIRFNRLIAKNSKFLKTRLYILIN